MRARSELVVVDDHGITRAARVRGEVPLVIRTVADDDGGLTAYLVGGAAGPLGGDDLGLTIDVGPGARLRVRSAAASMAMPGPQGRRSHGRIAVTVRDGAELDWWPEPLVSVEGSDHAVHSTIEVSGAASLRWVDEIVLGRHDEPGGRLATRQRLEVDGAVVLDHEVVTGEPHLDGPGANGPFRAMATALLHGAGRTPVPSGAHVSDRLRSATFGLGPETTLAVALAHDHGSAAGAVAPCARNWCLPVQFA